MAEPKFITVEVEAPPEALFDAQIDVAATLATNSALLRNAPLASHYTQRWLHYVRTRSLLQVGNRIAIGTIAAFVECELRGVDAMRGEGPLPWRSPRLIEAGARRAADESGGGSSAAGGSGGETSSAGAAGESREWELEPENLTKERFKATERRVKNMVDIFGNRPNRGQKVLAMGRNQEAESLTLPDDVASLYVVSQLVDAFTTRASGQGEVGGLPGLGEATWAKQREQWEKAGLDQKQQARCEGELQMRALRGLPFFVLKNGGTYYSGTMLKYVLGVENHQYVLFRMLRDVNRPGGRESARGLVGGTAESGGEGGVAESGGDESEGGSSDSEDSEGAQVRRRLLRRFNCDHSRWEAEGGFFSVGQDVRPDAPSAGGGVGELGDTEGGANDAEAGTSAQGARGESGGGGTSLARVQRTAGANRGHEMQLVLRAAAANTPAELVEVVAESTRAFGLPLQETLTVATLQVAQTSNPEEADKVWCAAVRQLAIELGKAGEVPRESAGEEEGAGEDPRDFSGIKGEVLEEDFFTPLKWGAKRKRSYDLAPAHTAPTGAEWIDGGEAEEDEWVAADEDAYRTDRPGLDVRTSVPFKGLGEIGRYHRDFSIPDQVVTMQASYDPELENRFKGRHNLWVLSALSRIFPQSVPITKTPGSETLFAVELVKEAVPGMTENAAQLGTAALAASEGVVVTPEMRVAGGHMALRRLARGVWAAKRLKEVVEPGPWTEGWAPLNHEERTMRTNALLALTVGETQARADIAASVAEEELRRMQPDVLDQAGGEEGEDEAGGEGSGEEEG